VKDECRKASGDKGGLSEVQQIEPLMPMLAKHASGTFRYITQGG
jgi:hypothetical protein